MAASSSMSLMTHFLPKIRKVVMNEKLRRDLDWDLELRFGIWIRAMGFGT